MTGGASGSPIVNASGEVLGINHSHDAGAGDFVGMTPATHSNYGTSMKHVLNAITVASKKNAVLLNLVHEIQKDNPTCKP
jgi:S1-C subfamily serine protease